MSEREEHSELIQHMVERLREHAQPYKEGAWEHFAATYGKRRRRLWPYWSAAATLLAAIGVYWFIYDAIDITPPSSQTVYHEVEIGTGKPTVSEAEADELPGAESVIDSETRLNTVSKYPVYGTEVSEEVSHHAQGLLDEPRALATIMVDTLVTAVAETEEETVAQQEPTVVPTIVPDRTSTITDRYAVNPPKTEGGIDKWDLGLVVSPSLTSEAVNLGGGLAVAYRVSDKFSIRSGISVAQLGVGENSNHRPQYNKGIMNSPLPDGYFNWTSEAAVNYKREVSVTSSVVTLDIPLDLRYEVINGFYTSVGLSYVAILDEQRTSHVIDRINKNTFAGGESSGTDRLTSTEFVYSSEKVADKPLQGNGYAGFMNFSVGKELPISKNFSLSIEPYFKLPIGRLSKEEMNFTNGGIRIVTGF
ncbi:hypothetical protein [Parapedobacter soli]|uniref:hypothetical protein n=1 Tax=Parapedobacter soli TaxID=416955 RepID=UPI0021C66E99|nr:hypothetical protein [Parapedobacter soli]